MKKLSFAILKKKLPKHTFYWQAAFTVLAFAAMVIISYFAMSATIRNHLARNSEAALDLALTKIEAELRGPETTLKTFAEVAQQRILAGTDADTILTLLTDLNRHLLAFDTNEVGYGYLFGIFYTLGPEPVFMHGSGWIPPADYDPPSRPWHQAAVAGGGRQARSPLYRAMSTGQNVFAITQSIQDESGGLLAVVCIQVPIAPLGKIITETAEGQGGHCMLLGHDLKVYAHINPDFIGREVPDPAIPISIFYDNFIKGEDVFERRLTSFTGEKSLAFFRKTQDGWYYGAVMPEAPYYKSITNIGFLLIALGVAAAAFLIYILARREAKKNRLEAQIVSERDFTKKIIDAAPIGLNIWDDALNIISCNDAVQNIFGCTKQYYAENFYELSSEYQSDGVKSDIKAKELLRRVRTGETIVSEWEHRSATGEPIPCEITLTRADYNNKQVAVVYIYDLRNLKRMEKAMLEAEQMLALREAEAKVREADERMQLMIEYAPFIVTLWDEDGQILDCNQEAVRVFGLSSKKEYMDGFFARGPEYQPNGMTTQELFTKARSHIFSETKYTQVEWAHNHGVTGETIPLNVTLVRIKYKDGYAALSYGQDLRERKKMEEETKKAYAEAMKAYAEAEAASEAKSRFVANMNHEMRTPMNVIVGLTELLLDEEDVPVKVKEMLYKINTAGTTLMGLISDVLDISKVDAGKMELTPVHYDVASFLNDIITLNVIRIEEKPIDFELDIHENLPRTLHGDDLRVKQILNNLLSNAFKYTKAGTVTLSVDCKRDGNTVWTSFYVTDTGIGIRAEDVGKLFTDYRQMDIKVNRKIEGTGLGLSITKRFVELMDGEITVESEYGKGTTFKVRIRQEFVTDEPIGKETVESLRSFRYSDRKKQAHRKLVRPDLSYARALVVDDFPTNLDVAAGMLGKYKMQVDCVTSGQESVNLISSGVPVYDVIFMDHMMPGMDGVEAVAAIRALGTEYAKNIPIVALTANAVAGHEKMFLDNGFNAFLPKPFNAVSLDAVVQMWVKQKTKKGVKDEKNY